METPQKTYTARVHSTLSGTEHVRGDAGRRSNGVDLLAFLLLPHLHGQLLENRWLKVERSILVALAFQRWSSQGPDTLASLSTLGMV